MAAAAQIVESMGADIVDVNMGCPVPKIAKHNAGCSLMRTPEVAAVVIGAMAKAVAIPVTVKMRAGWNDHERNCEIVAEMVQDAGARAITIHGRTAAQSYTGMADWDLVARVASRMTIPVFGSGDVVTASDAVEKLRSGVSGVLVGRGVLRNPWMLAQTADLLGGRQARAVTPGDRARFLLDYIALLTTERVREDATVGHDRWVINKVRALGGYYTKGVEGGAELRNSLNRVETLAGLRDLIEDFFLAPAG
jgi:tRNA-dihydrouridine synthase B